MKMKNADKKSQVEFILIVGIMVILIIIAIFVLMLTIVTPPKDTGISEEIKTIKDSVTNLVKTGAYEKLQIVYNQGGYSDTSLLSINPSQKIKFGGLEIPLWQGCNDISIPNINYEIGKSIEEYLKKELKPKMEFYGKKVNFDLTEMNVSVTIVKDKVNIEVNLPSRVENYTIPQPYSISMPSKLYDIKNFAKDFVNDTNKSRFFETLTVASMIESNPESGNWLPVSGVRIGCGNTLHKTRSELKPAMNAIIEYTVTHTAWNIETIRLAMNPFYPINETGGNRYDMEVTFHYPEEWYADTDRFDDNFAFSPDPLIVIPKPVVPLVPFCIASYGVSYSVQYPVVISVKDPILNHWFKFAVFVSIKDNQPSNCSAQLFSGETESTQMCDANALCKISLNVKNSTGDPIKDASVMFYICSLGRTNSNGTVSGNVPCMASELKVFKEEYKSYGNFLAANQIKDFNITMLKRIENLTFHYYGVPIMAYNPAGSGVYNNYTILGPPVPISIVPIYTGAPPPFLEKYEASIFFLPNRPNLFTGEDATIMVMNTDESGNIIDVQNETGFYPADFRVTAGVLKKEGDEDKLATGYFDVANFQLNENDRDLYIYLPVVLLEGLSPLTDSVSDSETGKLTYGLRSCGVEPVGKNPIAVDPTGCEFY
jgi:hypothetical protein